MDNLQTPLGNWHMAHHAKMAPFAGWNMPIQYAGILAEHTHTRTAASIFDICHMGEFMISGVNASEALSRAITVNIGKLRTGRCSYGFLLNGQGGILDDLVAYRLAENEFMLVVNAACRAADFAVLRERLPQSVTLRDISDKVGKIDLQGPLSRQVLQEILPGEWTQLPYFGFARGSFNGGRLLVSRTGYTGELGYEIYVPAAAATAMWEHLLTHGLVRPAGLGARDTLRLEAGLPLNGQDLEPFRTPAEAGYGAMLTSDAPYVGKERAFDLREVLTALSIPGRRSARHGNAVVSKHGEQAGVITSASFAPTLGHAVALAYIAEKHAQDAAFIIRTDRADLEAARVALPFYAGTARIKI
ncbi:MAG: glycine cleavage system aminomethyltransferase GcvT [Deltaproteobacteria bacterium]|nr:glycine cleavage system aminomethyltransferase GcvT [Deltaproteobacteria bacterium]